MRQAYETALGRLRACGYALSGCAGYVVAAVVLSQITVWLGLLDYRNHPWLNAMGLSCGLTAVWFFFPRYHDEMRGWRHFLWMWMIAGGGLALAVSCDGVWDDLGWLVHKATLGWLASVPQPSARVRSVIEAVAMLLAVGSVAMARVMFTGSDRWLLMAVGALWSVALARILYPDIIRLAEFAIVGFFISLSWGGPIGQSANAVLRNILGQFRKPRSSEPTTLEVPQTGTDVSKV